jgi:serine protease inhibitor
MTQETYTDPRTKIHKSNVINVDFHNKRKVDKKIVYQWVDAFTGVVNNYDSSKEDNVAHVELPFFCRSTRKTL